MWQFTDGRGELTIFIHPSQPVPDLTDISEKTAADRTLGQDTLSPDTPVAPGFVFAQIGKSEVSGEAVVIGPGNREIPVVEFPPEPSAAASGHETMQTRMDRAADATPPAQVAPGDCAVGILVRKDVLYFYPLAAVTTDAEAETYREGAGSTDELIHELPFQS